MEEEQMGKGIIVSIILMALLSISVFVLAGVGAALGSTIATQQVTVTVVSGFLNVYSPIDKIYQETNILLNLSVTTPLNISSIWMIDNGKSGFLCSKCKTYNQETYFPDGKHNIKIQVKFANGDVIEKNVSFSVDSSSEIYILSGNILKKATAKDIVNYLFNYDFTVVYKNDSTAPEDSCSVAARNGNATLNNLNFGNSNNINFYSIISIEQGQGTFSAQKGRTRISVNFIVNKTLENSDSLLELQATDKKTNESYIIDFDKTKKTVAITGQNVSIGDMKVSSSKGCSTKKASFYFLQNNGKTSRTIQEVRQILNDNPIFLERHANLNFLFTSNWQVKKFFGLY